MPTKGGPKPRTRREGPVCRTRRTRHAGPHAAAPARGGREGLYVERVAELTHILEHYRDLFDNAPIPYVMLDPLGVIIEANLTYADLVQVPRRALVGKPLVHALVEQDRKSFYGHMRRCRRDNAARTEVQLEAQSGTIVPVELDSRLAPGIGNEPPRFRTAIIDLRERQQVENARVAADRERQSAEQREQQAQAANDAKDRFLAELSHELRTPLTPILAAITTLAGDANLAEGLRPTIAMIHRNMQAEVRLIDELLDVSRMGRRRPQLELESVDAHAAIQEVAGELGHQFQGKGVDLSLRLNAGDTRIRADQLRLHQILWNVVSNALQNTDTLGSVVVTTSNIDSDLRIVVRDDGVGIAAEQLEDVFRPFFREDGKRGEGLGLGLAIVKNLVEAHRGRIHAFSAGKGRGATFAIELPLPESEPPAVAPPATNKQPAVAPSAQRRVLLVEDHADTREALQMFLEMKGYEVRLAKDARSALEAAREPVDVVVCDIGLPDESGFDVIRKISAERPVKAIALTGYGGPREQRLAIEAGFAAHLTKPVGAEKLAEAIERLFAT
ncbi:MAG: ATP-binding protein [Candidatus Binatia bacterium]